MTGRQAERPWGTVLPPPRRGIDPPGLSSDAREREKERRRRGEKTEERVVGSRPLSVAFRCVRGRLGVEFRAQPPAASRKRDTFSTVSRLCLLATCLPLLLLLLSPPLQLQRRSRLLPEVVHLSPLPPVSILALLPIYFIFYFIYRCNIVGAWLRFCFCGGGGFRLDLYASVIGRRRRRRHPPSIAALPSTRYLEPRFRSSFVWGSSSVRANCAFSLKGDPNRLGSRCSGGYR